MKKHVNFPLKLIAVLALALTTRQGLAQQWMWESGAQTSDGSVQVQPMNGGSAMALPQNPTGASAMTSMSALTQPPTVLNAMATLPIVQEHTACERTATEGDTAAVNADRTLLLTCRPNPKAPGSPLQWMRPNPPVVVEGEPCRSPNGQQLEDGAIGKTSTGLILSCQSGMWGKQFALDGKSVNFYTESFALNTCPTAYTGGYPCRAVNYRVSVNKPSAVIASIYSGHDFEYGHDVVVGIIIDGSQCGANRFPASRGYTGIASASCSKWVQNGEILVTLYLTSSTRMALSSNGLAITGSILVF